MTAHNFWQVFLETGAPEMYLLFNHARRMEEGYAPDNPGIGASGN